MKEFALGEVLTALSGLLLCEVAGVYRVLNFLTGETLYTHQLPRAFRVCQPFVADQHPDLAALDWSGVDTTNWRAWLAAQETRFGTRRSLTPIPPEAYTHHDPVTDAIEMVGPDKVIVVAPDSPDR
jgi:hypothetical protein